MPLKDAITLTAGGFNAVIHPSIGGSLGSFTWQHPDGHRVPLLREMSAAAIAAGSSEAAACFPLMPFSNRIRGGQFSFDGRVIFLPRNTSGPHVEHGHGWQRPWSVQHAGDSAATISFTHDPATDGTWPFAYTAEQHVALGPDGLAVTLSARNLDARPMPLGLGLHPYFPRTPLCRLQAQISGFWETDAEVLPTRHRDVPASLDLRPGLAMNDVVVDNCFTGFAGIATISWPEQATRLVMTAEGPLRFLTVYVPDAATVAAETAAGTAPYFCAEPVSNITDAANFARRPDEIDTGLITLAPGAEISATIRFSPSAAGG